MQRSFVSKFFPGQYRAVPDAESEWKTSSGSSSRQRIRNALFMFVCFVAGAFGYITAHFFANYVTPVSWTSQALECTFDIPAPQHVETESADKNTTVNQIRHTFQYDRNFSYPPSNHTNRAWRNIFPDEGGFFVHPIIAPTRSTFSVFHQLHCLNGLRGGYFANQRAASEGRKLTDADLPVDIQQSHMRHCIDLIRQSLMCQADTTLEVVDETINGVHGFRTPHICKDWEQLKSWTSAQQRVQHVEQIV